MGNWHRNSITGTGRYVVLDYGYVSSTSTEDDYQIHSYHVPPLSTYNGGKVPGIPIQVIGDSNITYMENAALYPSIY